MSTESFGFALAAASVTLIAVTVLFLLGLAYWDFRKNLKLLITSVERISRLDSDLASIPELVKGLIKVAESLVDNTVTVTKSVDKFHGDLFSGAPKESAAYQPYNEGEASAMFDRSFRKPDEVNINSPDHFTLGR